MQGDGLFHLARARKLLELDALSLERVSEFADGSLHPGYAFPLWHGFLALVSKLAGVDPTDVVLRVSEEGGFMMMEAVMARVPLFTLYGDGRVVFRDPMAEGPPAQGSAFLTSPLRTAMLTEDQVQAVIHVGLIPSVQKYSSARCASASLEKQPNADMKNLSMTMSNKSCPSDCDAVGAV